MRFNGKRTLKEAESVIAVVVKRLLSSVLTPLIPGE
jgi:hypothetical protein